MKRRGFLGTLFGGLAVALGLKAAEPVLAAGHTGSIAGGWAMDCAGLRKGDVITISGEWGGFPAERPAGRYVIEADVPSSEDYGLKTMRNIQSFNADWLP